MVHLGLFEKFKMSSPRSRSTVGLYIETTFQTVLYEIKNEQLSKAHASVPRKMPEK